MSSISNVSVANYAVASQAAGLQSAGKVKGGGTSGGPTFPSDSVTISANKAAPSLGLDSDLDGDVDKAGQPDKDTAAVSARAFQQQLTKAYAPN